MSENEIIEKSKDLAIEARCQIVKMTSLAKASHVGSALSVVDILAVLYSGVANIDCKNFEEPNRDIVILSKGHAASALYSILSLKNFFPKEWLLSYCEDAAKLGGHVTSQGVPGVELSTGSLGHGLPYGVGIAISRKLTNISGRIFVVLSDGECDEGTTWESALLSNHLNLNNLVIIVDRNGIQSLKSTEETLALEPFLLKWKSFGFEAVEVDGHSYKELIEALKQSNSPKVVIAKTVKGKGVNFMENSVMWHYRSPNKEELIIATDEIRKNS